MPAFCYLLAFLLIVHEEQRGDFGRGKIVAVATMLLLVFIACNAAFLLGHFRDYYDHFKILTYGALLLILPLAICRPKYMERKADGDDGS